MLRARDVTGGVWKSQGCRERGRVLDRRVADNYIPGLIFEVYSDETIVSPAQQAPDQQARFPRADGDTLGSCRVVAAPEEGPQTADGTSSLEARGLLTAAAGAGAAGFPRNRRLASAADIRRCLAKGRRRRLEHLDVIWTDNLTGHPRLGLIVPKVRSSAVARNRLRRRLREIWRREIQARQPAWDLIIRARREGYEASFAALRGELLGWRDATMRPVTPDAVP